MVFHIIIRNTYYAVSYISRAIILRLRWKNWKRERNSRYSVRDIVLEEFTTHRKLGLS